MKNEFSSNDDIINVEDIAQRIEELREERDGYDNDIAEAHQVETDCSDEVAAQYAASRIGAPEDEMTEERAKLSNIESLMAELQGAGGDFQWEGDWYPSHIIAESHMRDYAQQMAEDCDMIKPDAGWPYTCIDWERATEEFKQDYTIVEFNGNTFYCR